RGTMSASAPRLHKRGEIGTMCKLCPRKQTNRSRHYARTMPAQSGRGAFAHGATSAFASYLPRSARCKQSLQVRIILDTDSESIVRRAACGTFRPHPGSRGNDAGEMLGALRPVKRWNEVDDPYSRAPKRLQAKCR